jgi:hypothetical protein
VIPDGTARFSSSRRSIRTRSIKYAQVERVGHQLVASIAGVQHVRRVGLDTEACRILRIPGRGIEVHDGIKGAARANPLIRLLPDRFASLGVHVRTAERGQRAADDLQPVEMGGLDDLPIGGNEVVCGERQGRRRSGGVRTSGRGDVVDPLEQRDPPGARHAERVRRQPRQAAVVVAEDTVAGDAGVHDSEARRPPVCLQPGSQERRPHGAGIRCRLIAVRDRVPERDDGLGIRRRHHIDAGQPVVRLGRRGGIGDVWRTGEVPFARHIGRPKPERMTRRRAGVAGKVHAHRQIGQRPELEGHGIADEDLPRVHRRGSFAAERERAIGARYERGVVGAHGDVGRAYRDRCGSERIEQSYANALSPDARPHDHANRLVVQSG